MKKNKKTLFLMGLLLFTLIVFSGENKITSRNGWLKDLNYLIKRLEITHPNLYANVEKNVFYKRAEEIRRKASTFSDIDFIFQFYELLALVRDDHTKVSIESSKGDIIRLFHIFPVRFYLFRDGLFVISADKKHQKIVGKKVVKIGKLTADEVIKRFSIITPADNKYGVIKKIEYVLNRSEVLKHLGASDMFNKITLIMEGEDRKQFKYEMNSEPFSWRINHFVFPISEKDIITMNENSKSPLPLYLSHPNDNYWYKYLPEKDAIYLNVHHMYQKKEKKFNKFCKEMFSKLDRTKAKKLIIDIRHNVGGNNFFEASLIEEICQRPGINHPDRLFLITGRTTFSAGQHFATQITKYTKATVFGEPTSGKPNHYGSTGKFKLPNSEVIIKCSINNIQDSEYFDWSIATWPDFCVSLKSSDYINNYDPVINMIFNYKKIIQNYSNINKEIQDAYLSDSIKGFKNKYYKLKRTINELGIKRKLLLGFFRNESEFDSWLWKNKKCDIDYTQYLYFLSEEFPDSYKVNYWIGLSMKNSGKTRDAKKYFKRCLELRPEHHYARMCLDIINLEEKLNLYKVSN